MTKTSRKQAIKRSLNPFVSIAIRIMHVKVFGKHIFANKYVRKVPIFSQVLSLVDTRLRISRTVEERKQEYSRWFKKNFPSQRTLREQRKLYKKFKHKPLVSIIIPTYNTDNNHLRECLDSVISQTYGNWQLCIADDHSTDPKIRSIIEEYADKDKRISYTFRDTNGHICVASNTALELAKGKYIALLDHDDYLWPNALYEVVKLVNKHPDAKFVYTDEDKIAETSKRHINPFFKPDWSFEFLRSINYITHFAVLDTKLVRKVGGFREGYEGAQDWDLFLRASRTLKTVYHVPKILYSWRMSPNSTAQAPSSKDYAYINQKKVLEDDINSRGLKAKLDWQIPFSMWRVRYEPKRESLVSIIIPTKNQYAFIKRCLESISEKTTYKNFEVVIVDTGSTEENVWDLYDDYKKTWPKMQVTKWKKEFNFAAACNLGADKAHGDYFLFLNNDTEVISPDWIQDMLGYAQQEGVGEVGCKLYYPDRKIQHAGIILGVGGQDGTPGIAGHFYPAFIDNPPQDPAQLTYIGGTRNFAAVTAAVVMVEKKKFYQAKGFDPSFKIAFNDVDLCLKLYSQGYRNVYLPHVELYHHESISVGQPGQKHRDLTVFAAEIDMMLSKWGSLIENDPFYHPEFRRDIASARLRD